MSAPTAAHTRFRIVNLDHYNTLPGGVGMPHDRAVVLSTRYRARTFSAPSGQRFAELPFFRGWFGSIA